MKQRHQHPRARGAGGRVNGDGAVIALTLPVSQPMLRLTAQEGGKGLLRFDEVEVGGDQPALSSVFACDPINC
jgi:hypothetical protein